MIVEVRLPGGVEELSVEELEQRVRDGELGPDTLVRMDAVTGDRFAPLRSLELYLGLANPEEQGWREQLRTTAPVVTAALVGVQVRIYLWTKVPGTLDQVVDRLTNWAPAVTELGEVYRLLTYGFLHLSFSHLALNLIFLAYAGSNLERALGRRNVLTVFLVSVVCGGLLSFLFSGSRPSLGSSGGDFGLLAAALVFGLKNDAMLPVQQRQMFGWALTPYIVYPLALGLLSNSVDNWGHLGGLLGGGLASLLLEPEAFERARGGNRGVRRGAVLLGGIVLSLLWAVGPWLVTLEPIEAGGLRVACPSRWTPGWTFSDDWGRVSPTGLAAFTATRRTYDAPLSAEAAGQALVEQLDDRAQGLTIASAEPRLVEGRTAMVSRLEFRLDGVPQVLYAMVVPRGAHVYRVTVQCRARENARCGTLAERIFASASLSDPPELVEAREKVMESPDSWESNLDLGVAAANAGLAAEAERALNLAYGQAGPQAGRVAVALLELYADYPGSARLNSVNRLIAAHPDDIEVVLAANAALQRLGARAEAEQLMIRAAERWPEDPGLRRALRPSP